MAFSAKPKAITLFNRLYLAATLVGIANAFIHYAVLRNLAISRAASPAGPIVGVFLLLLSYAIFWFFICRWGSNIAKWLFVAVTVISIAMIPLNLREVAVVGVAYVAIDGIAFALQIAAVAMLFRSDAKAWLSRKGNHQTSI